MNYRTLVLATAVAALATSASASYVANIGVIPPFGPQQWNCASNSYATTNERFILQFIDATHIAWNRNGTVEVRAAQCCHPVTACPSPPVRSISRISPAVRERWPC
jgi:hypothetical protein